MLNSGQKICLLLAGGTALAPQQKKTSVLKQGDIKSWLAKIPEASLLAEIEPVFISAVEGSDVHPVLWSKIAREIYKRWDDYDAFIVTQSNDVILYAALALSFMLQKIAKPIIFTGAQSESSVTETQDFLVGQTKANNLGIRANLIGSMQGLNLQLPGVKIFFNGVLLDMKELSIFSYFVGGGRKSLTDYKRKMNLEFFSAPFKNGGKKLRPLLRTDLNSRVCILRPQPGMGLTILEKTIKNQDGILIHTYRGDFVPSSWLKLLERKAREIPVVVHSRRSRYIPLDHYPDFIFIDNMTPEMAWIKLMWLLGQTKELQKIKKMLRQNLIGELIDESRPALASHKTFKKITT